MTATRVPRVVVDTNVVLDCWVFDDPAARPLRAALERRDLRAVRSAETDAELDAVLARPRFGLDAEPRRRLLQHWQALAELTSVATAAPVRCADPADQKFLDLAYAAHAAVLFTKDKALLATAARARAARLKILPPRAAGSALLFEDDVA
ncbi:MAG TPA: putative toxin-antitoxin system toxin component, PIN family [Burkholderiaceae bacterium]|nr:putative toxin-antitoxin system toxin component, PIN family [Burkholderiaceae bacterium]